MTTAREQLSVAFELRAAISAARHARREGRTAGSHSNLKLICDRLTEGFETADYLEARQLLQA